MAGTTGYPRLMAAGGSANDAFLDAITAAVDTLDTYVARVNASAVIAAGDNTSFKMQGLNGPAVSGASRTVKLLGRLGSEDQTFLDALNAIAATFAAYRTAVNANAAIVAGDTTCYKVQDVNGAAVTGATVFYRSTSRFDTDFDDLETQINGMVDALSQFASAWNLKQGGTPTTLVVCTVKRLRPFTRPNEDVENTERNIAVDGGNNQSAAVVTQPTTAFTVVVTDGNGALVEGEQVTWATSGAGSITAASLTNALGIATATPTTGQVAQTETYTATTSTGQSVSFTLTATAGTAAQISAASATDQSALTSAAVSAPPSVLVQDVYGNAKSGVTVTFAVTAGGGARDPATVNTNSSGIATLTSWTLGGSAGLNTLTATASGLTGSPVTFNANAVAAAPTQIAVQSGGSQTGVTAGQAATATVFRVKDVSNNAVAGVTVACTITSGNGSLSAASAVTDASGDASFTYTTDELIETATIKGAFTNASGTEVSASTTIASTFGTKNKLAIQTQPSSNGSSGTALSQQPIILIQDANGNTVTSATDTITATVQSGNAVLAAGSTKAAVAGVATFSGMTLTDTDSGANVLRFSSGALTTVDSENVTLAPPVAVALQFSGPISDVTEDTGILVFNVLVVDENNTAVPGATNAVTVALTTPGGATLSGDATVNASAGVAAFGATEALTVDTVGTYTLTATASGLTSAVSASFAVTAATGTNEPSGMSAWSTGDLSTQTLNTAFGTGGASHLGWQWYTGGGNMRVQTISDQSWRTVGTTIPVCPNGQDRVLVCRMAPSGGGITAGEKGLAEKTPPTGTKSLYGRYYALVSSNWRGNPISGLKRHYVKTATAGPLIMMYYGQNGGSLGFRAHYQAPNANQVLPSTGLAMVRNTWYLFEYLVVLPTTANGTDGHVTIWLDGSKVYQRTDASFDAATLGRQQWLHYMGGSGSTDTNAVQYCLTGDAFYFSTSTSRIAIP